LTHYGSIYGSKIYADKNVAQGGAITGVKIKEEAFLSGL
jgi:hypothetical protein